MTTSSFSNLCEFRTLWMGAERFVIPVEVDADAPTNESADRWYEIETVDFERDIRV